MAVGRGDGEEEGELRGRHCSSSDFLFLEDGLDGSILSLCCVVQFAIRSVDQGWKGKLGECEEIKECG